MSTTIVTICTFTTNSSTSTSMKRTNTTIIRRILPAVQAILKLQCSNFISYSGTSTSTRNLSIYELAWRKKNNTNSNNKQYYYFSSYSRMLDLGGAPSSMNDSKAITRIDVSKNSKIRAILIDFDLLTSTSTSTSIPSLTTIENDNIENNSNDKSGGEQENVILGKVTPDIALIENVTNLLQKTRGSFTNSFLSNNNKSDDLSLLLSDDNSIKDNKENTTDSDKKIKDNNNKTIKNMMDITAKYSDKLSQRGIQGGAKGLLVLKEQKEYNNQSNDSNAGGGGDASDHLAARKLVISNRSTNTIEGHTLSSNRWMSLPGTGVLLKYLSNRSMKIVLLPILPISQSSSSLTLASTTNTTTNPEENYYMNDFQKQLEKDVHITYLHQDGTQSIIDILNNCIQQISSPSTNPSSSDTTDTTTTTTTTTTTSTNNGTIMIVSNKDNYLSIAKTLGILTVRLCPPNTRRGNVSCHYTIQSLSETQDIINSINGISFKK